MNLKGAKRCSCGVIQGVLSLSLAWWLSMLSPIWYLKALKCRQPVSTERFLLQRQLERKQNLGYAGESQLFGDDTNYLLLWEHLATMQGWEGAPWFLSSGPEWQIVFKKLSPNLLTSTSALIFHIPQHPKHPLRLKSPVVTIQFTSALDSFCMELRRTDWKFFLVNMLTRVLEDTFISV